MNSPFTTGGAGRFSPNAGAAEDQRSRDFKLPRIQRNCISRIGSFLEQLWAKNWSDNCHKYQYNFARLTARKQFQFQE